MGQMNPEQPHIKTPEEWLAAAEGRSAAGSRCFGVRAGGGQDLQHVERGDPPQEPREDVVIGIVETHGRSRTTELAAQLEQVPRKQMEYKGAIFEEMDVDAVLARRPEVVLIDELAHTNVEGCAHPKRFQDVLQILEAEIDVLTTLNVQHVRALRRECRA